MRASFSIVMLHEPPLQIISAADIERLVGAFEYINNVQHRRYFFRRAAFAACLIAKRFLVFFDREVLFLVFVDIRFAMGTVYHTRGLAKGNVIKKHHPRG